MRHYTKTISSVLLLALVLCASCNSDPSPVAADRTIVFGDIEWTADAPVTSGVLNPTWCYRNDKLGMRLVERREPPGKGAADWRDFKVFSGLKLMTREMQVRNPMTAEWASHGLTTLYYDDGSIAYALNEAGASVRELGVKIPPQEWLWKN